MAYRTQLLSFGLTIATALSIVVAATSGEVLVSSEVVRGKSALSILRCTYARGLQIQTLHFVVTPESAGRCAWVPASRR